MPSPANPQRPSNRGGGPKTSPTKQKPLDIGVPLGIYDTNSVRSKVRIWQQQGGGVIAANDGVCYDDDDNENSAADSKSKPPDDKDSGSSNGSGRRRRAKSTPRRRVISDEHWKLNRTATTQKPASTKFPSPNKRISEYTTNEPVRSPRAGEDDSERDDKPRPSPSRSRERGRGAVASDLATRERRKSRAPRDVDSIPEGRLEEERASHNGSSKSLSRPTTADKANAGARPETAKNKEAVLDDDSEWATSEADFSELSRRRARGPNAAVKSPAHKGRTPLKPPKGGIFSHMLDESRKMFTKPDPPKAAPPRGAKIQAWLSETPDPFVDDMESDVEIPAPLNTRAGRKKSPAQGEDIVGSDADPADGGTPKKDATRRHARSKEGSSGSERMEPKEEKVTPEPPKDPASSTKKKEPAKADELPIRERARESKDSASETGTQPLSEGSEVSASNAPEPLGRRRPFPSTGAHSLSTIASVETMSTTTDFPTPGTADPTSTQEKLDEEEKRDQFDPDSLPVVSSQLKRRLTTHDDLISVLSSPSTRSRSLRSARSLKSKDRVKTESIPDILKELAADEVKYMRELKTLVGGVIPVLLTCVLSKSDSAIAAGLFRPSADPKDEINFSKPIVDMGVAIERLKTLHKRIPQENVDLLLNWANGAQRVYREYLKAWRLGFKDVIVNLAPLEEGEGIDNTDTKSLDEGMARDENGDVVDSDGEKVDVAYLLKRPLVRLKYLAKTFKAIKTLQSSPKAEETAAAYQSLVTEARRRAREERARLEDESAACIDATRARDPATLGALIGGAGVTVDRSKRVRARDFFDLSLYHTSGQIIDCRTELLLRDSTAGNKAGGDLLICEIDQTDRWLLFPPMELGRVSARNGDKKGELVVMLRSAPDQAKPWKELLVLQIDEDEIGKEWVQMLGTTPVPPVICRTQSFIDRAKRQRAKTISSANEISQAQKAPPSPTNVNVPIGEKANARALRRSLTPREMSDLSAVESSATESRSSLQTAITPESDYATGDAESPEKSSPRSHSILHARAPRKSFTGDERPGLKRSKAKRVSRYGEIVPSSPTTPTDKGRARDHDETKRPEERKPKVSQIPKTPVQEKSSPRVSSVPSMDLPAIPKLRKGSSQTYVSDSLASTSDDEYAVDSIPETPTKYKRRSQDHSDSDHTNEEEPPAPPPHSRSPSSTGSSLPNTPVLSPSAVRPKRRGSSPLKHEYEPSTASDSASDSDTSTVRRYDVHSGSEYSDSDSSDESADESAVPVPVPAPAPAPAPEVQAPPKHKAREPASSSSLSLSNSASQGGYRSVPSQPSKSSAAIASVFAWSDKGSWDSIFPDDCKILVSPGLIEAYNMANAPSGPQDETSASRIRPLIALELTPLVPIRRGTAIDISIRSPPTKRSKINWSNNIMFRSRNADECEVLYNLINHARINNPTYIALQNARGPYADQPAPMETPSKDGGLFGWPRRRRSYRASGSPRSIADNSDSSVGTMSSAFSALKRFGAGSKMFNISRSSLTSRDGQNEDSLYSSSIGSASNPSSGIGRIAAAIKGVDGIGLSNAKIRLYLRETQSKWRDMGAARLTIMPVSSDPASGPGSTADGLDGSGSPPGSGSASPRRGIEPEKRILVRGKTRNEVLLDVCLGESSFERVARTGIAVSVWEENEGGAMPKKGGVTVGSSRIYMIQMKSEAEAAYTFGLVGKSKY
ncbi:hypothetical protein BO70DRAFT_308671 [Aspergillus heteromorphus CBS 117.55]|uniref:Uncharacterized protein n=1 Tax=Aspergillus heteromorphus CBS 117.55 TaxID=1448321 RepID=A0A317WXR3_9EURO|nr:uncharacterized protein BO70DRAFT_308671 [Aspergillus heteromorphus CBS 117.55]PWY90122.1 hypothetical protein BO70DRAFT_308671 [Aspergillus heteromorphus CBS 117.55]